MARKRGPSAYRRSAHSARPSNTDSGTLVVTHPFHPLTGRRLRILFERRRASGRLYVCEGVAEANSVTLVEDWTDRGEPPAQRVLTYERLAELVKTMSAIRGG